MTTLRILIKRNIKLFFKDKGMFFTSLATPAILLLLYATFLGNVYKDSLTSLLSSGLSFSDKLVNGYVGCQLISSILAVSCITVAFCSNMLSVQDKANGTIHDLCVTPVKASTLALSYYVATFISTLIICLIAVFVCLIYVSKVGWYMTLSDVLFLILDIFLLVSFGTALSSVINFFLNSQGQISAVGTVISSCYGFVCGAYMPISQFSEGLQKVIMFLPGTYGTSLIRNHAMRGIFEEMHNQSIPKEIVEMIKDTVDCNIYFFDNKVSVTTMYSILVVTVLVLITLYIIMNKIRQQKTK